MSTGLSAFPADGYTARWNRADGEGGEELTLRWENEGWTAHGELSGERVTYVMRLSPTWQVRQFLLFRDLADPDLWLGTDGGGRWGEVNGAHRPDLDGCTDVHLDVTPFSVTIPIRRLSVEVGDGMALRAARVDIETLGVVPAHLRYRRLAERTWQLATDGSEVAFDVDEYGLPHDLPGRFLRH